MLKFAACQAHKPSAHSLAQRHDLRHRALAIKHQHCAAGSNRIEAAGEIVLQFAILGFVVALRLSGLFVADPQIKAPADLKGKSIAANSLAA
ncbi:MAG TPA: hypothetical protein VNN13_10945, partial [Methylomirabilota bacterium]|nr:hypothetical protein [Methylomirabilota bacterium]